MGQKSEQYGIKVRIIWSKSLSHLGQRSVLVGEGQGGRDRFYLLVVLPSLSLSQEDC